MTGIDWRCKGFPPELDGLTAEEVADRGVSISDFMLPHGVRRLLLANQLVDPVALE